METQSTFEAEDLEPVLRHAHECALHEVLVTLESENNFYTGVTNDIGEGGVFIAIDDPPPIGSELSFELQLGEDGPCWPVMGVIRWIRSVDVAGEGSPAGCGVEWFWIPPRALVAVNAFVAHREPLFYEPT
jgi:Tfp pilus assembly protein PilZ